MAKEKVDAKVSTGIGIDTTSAVKSINSLENAVKSSTNEWKQMENQMKRADNSLGASETKYKGLSDAVSKQQDVLTELKKQQGEVNRETADGEKVYQQYESQITKAETKLTSMTGQLEKAHRAYQLEESGINSLNRELQQHNKEVDAHVQRLEAEGKQTEANEAKRKGLGVTIEKQTKLYEAQVKEMERLKSSGEASDDALSKQKIALDRTATSLAKSKNEFDNFGKSQTEIGNNDGAEKASSKMEHLKGGVEKSTKAIVGMGAVAGATLAGIVKAVSEVSDAQQEVNTLQARTTLGYGKSKESILAINKLYANGYGESMEDLQDTYSKIAQLNPHASVKQLAEDTKLVSTYAKLSGADAEEVMQGADRATKSWHISYKDYFDQMTMLQKRGDDVGGDLSDNMAEYAQVMGQMGFSAKETASIIDNGIKAGAYDADKVMDYVKEFNNSVSDGRLEANIGNMSKKSQEMFDGYKKGKVPMKDLFNQITGDIGTMKDKQEAATLASNIWGGLGEDNALKVVGGLGKTNKAFDNVKGTADKTSKQLKESNPFELLKRGAESSIKSVSMSASETKKFNEALKPLKKAVTNLIQAIIDNMPKIMKAITPVLTFVTEHGKAVATTIGMLLGLGVTAKVISSASKIAGAFGSMKNAFSGTASFFKKHSKSLNVKGKASLVTSKAKQALTSLGGFAKKSGKTIGKALKYTANVSISLAQKAMGALVKTAKSTGKAIKLAFNFLKANPFIMIVTGVAMAITALVELYKHNKKFRKFVNDLIKSVKDLYKNITKWFKEMWNKVIQSWNSFSKSFTKGWNNFKNSFSKSWNALTKSLSKLWSNLWKGMTKVFNAYISTWKKIINSFKKFFVGIWNTIKKTVSSIAHALWKALTSGVDAFSKSFKRSWNNIKNFFSDTWKNIKKIGHDAIWALKGTFDSVLGKIGKAFSNTWKGIKDGFKSMWEGMKQLAGDGINAVIKIPNAGISGINGLIHDFGGPKHAIGKIPKVHFATGTGAFSNVRKPITKPTLATLNDGNDSPETGNREMLLHPNGQAELVEGRNTQRILGAGTEVLNASETAMLLGMKATPFAKGTGFWSRAWNGVTSVAGNAWNGLKNGVEKFTKMFEYITGAVAHPIKTLEGKFNPKTDGLDAVYKDLGLGLFKKTKNQAQDWWKTLWSMADDASNSGATGGMKGDDYLYKNRGADSGSDPWGYFFKECVSFVASRLKNSGVSASKFSHLGNGSDWVNAPVRHTSKPRPGMVAVYGPGSQFGNHVAMVTGVQGGKISGEEYNWLGQHKYHTYTGRPASGATTFLDFGLGGNADKPEVKADSPMAKLIKRQTGGMMKFIQKFIAPLNDSSTGTDNDVHSWSDDVKKALNKLGLSTSASMVQKVLRQISTESGGNANARQPGADPDGDGSGPALGLMQTKRSTFNANALPGHKNIFNGYDNILAGLNYARKRYGDSLSFLGNGHGYENGGIVSQHGLYEVAERNMPEMIIPLSGDKRPRANQLLEEAQWRVNGKSKDDSLVDALSNIKGGDTYEITININADTTQATINKIQQAVENGITRKQSVRGRTFA